MKAAAKLTAEERADLEVALEMVQSTQKLFWEKLNNLESLLGHRVDLESGTDYEEWDVDYVIGLLGSVEDDGDDA